MRWLLVLVVSVSAPALAQKIYTWVDAEGTTHYTDNLAAVPKDTRVQLTEGEAIGWVLGADDETTKASKATAKAEEPGEFDAAAARVRMEKEEKAEARKREEERWRKLFRDARERVASLESDIKRDEERLEPGGLPVAAGYVCPPWASAPTVLPPMSGVTGWGTGQVGPGTHVGISGTIWSTAPIPPMVATPCVFQFNPEVDRVRDRLASNREALERAKEALKDLERRAAFEAVPLEWRR